MNHNHWRQAVLERDGYKCVRCECTNRLHAHHIKRRSTHPHLSLVVDNGETLCASCHADEHELDMPSGIVRALRGEVRLNRGKKKLSIKKSKTSFDLLKRSGLSKRKLSKILGVDPTTVTKWGDNPPKYVIAYLELYVQIKEINLP